MRFTTARLCGGKALMAVSADIMDLDIDRVASILESDGSIIKSRDDMMVIYDWNGMEVTLYRQGKVMFMPLEDKPLCIKYATEILEHVRRST